tara:strand:+ start:1542 stop:2816 length:1275 start_codon:yes stop_codon:yes gene_type:complete
MPTYVSPFTGTVVTQTQVSYGFIALSSNQSTYWPASTPSGSYTLARILDVIPSAASLTLTLPQANQGTTGADSLIRNFGAVNFTVYSFDNAESYVIAPGQSWYFYLVDNSTEGGSWNSVQFGTGTSSADAAALAGNGLQTVDGLLWTSQNVIDITSAPALSQASSAFIYNWTTGNGTITLPLAGNLIDGWYIGFRNSGTGGLTFDPQGTSTVNGNSSLVTNPGDSGFIVFKQSTGDFYTLGLAAPNQSIFTSSVYDVDSIGPSAPNGPTLDLTSYAPVIQTYVDLTGTRTSPLDVVLPPITQLYILTNNTGYTSFDIAFNVDGGTGPDVLVPSGGIATVLTDGTSIYQVTQSVITGNFLANNGTAAAPTYSFTSDTNTGMYLNNPNVLGIVANGANMILVDNSTTPVVTVTGQLKAGSIQGGTF